MNDHQWLLRVHDLKVYFHGPGQVAKAVDGVSYDVKRGECVCIVGESGCGKTVSALSILGLVPCPPGEIVQGRILFNGQDLLQLDEEQLRKIRGRRIGMVFQEPLTSLNPVFTIGDQIAEVIETHETLEQGAIRARCIKLLRDVGIGSPEDRLNDYPHQLSGGQRQRVMIAIALACNPDLMIADEPTTALDVTVQAQILNLLDELRKARQMSVLYITHDLGVVASIADRIFVMYAGTVVEHGQATLVLNDPCHPYTRGLIESLPEMSKRGKPLHSIPGTVPNPAFKPPGCPFHPRCALAKDSCKEEFPKLYDFGGGHMSRCPVLYDTQ